MFTGIIETMGKIERISQGRYEISAPILSELTIGQSIAHDGVCLTVVEIFSDRYAVEAVPETLRRSNLGEKRVGDLVNLERAMAANGRFEGHIVQGHVDGTTSVLAIREIGNSHEVEFSLPADLSPLLVEKGSITINGVSLTVMEAKRESFSVAIIPHTWRETNFHTLKIGSTVNLEADILAKYLWKWRN